MAHHNPLPYGDAFIACMKADDRYGDLFTYEQYQLLHAVESSAQFAAFIKDTAMAECLVFDDPAVTWSYSCILEQREMARKAIWDFFALDIVSLLLLPLFPLWVLVCRIRISTFTNRLRHIRLQHDRPASADS